MTGTATTAATTHAHGTRAGTAEEERPGSGDEGDGEPAEDHDDAGHVAPHLARGGSQLDLAEAAHVERVQLASVMGGHVHRTEGGDRQDLGHSVGVAGVAATGKQLAVGGEAGVDPPRREVLVDPLSRGVPMGTPLGRGLTLHLAVAL